MTDELSKPERPDVEAWCKIAEKIAEWKSKPIPAATLLGLCKYVKYLEFELHGYKQYERRRIDDENLTHTKDDDKAAREWARQKWGDTFDGYPVEITAYAAGRASMRTAPDARADEAELRAKNAEQRVRELEARIRDMR